MVDFDTSKFNQKKKDFCIELFKGVQKICLKTLMYMKMSCTRLNTPLTNTTC